MPLFCSRFCYFLRADYRQSSQLRNSLGRFICAEPQDQGQPLLSAVIWQGKPSKMRAQIVNASGLMR
jgi:hypothetical protein